MFVKKIIITFNVVMICLLLCSCDYKSKDIINEYNSTNSLNEKNIIEEDSHLLQYSTLPYTIRMGMSYCVYFDTINKNRTFDTVRYIGNKVYTISRQADGSYMFMLFEETNISENEKKLMLIDGLSVHKLTDKNTFKDIQVGTLKEDVLHVDPSAYVFGDLYSFHRFSDKSVVQIHYKTNTAGEYVVSEIIELDTEHSVLTYLLPKDFSLIAG